MKVRVPIWLLCLFVSALVLAGCGRGKEPASVASATLTDQVEARTKAPLRPLTAFPKDTKQMYLSVLVKNPQKGTRIEAQWFFDPEGKDQFAPIDEPSPVVFDAASRDKYVAYSLQATTTFPSGAYKVTVSLDGKQVQTIPFRVE